jgi:hypothetical protein
MIMIMIDIIIMMKAYLFKLMHHIVISFYIPTNLISFNEILPASLIKSTVPTY